MFGPMALAQCSRRPTRALALTVMVMCTSACVPFANQTSAPRQPSVAAVTLQSANAAFFRNRYSQAEELFKKFVQQNPNSAAGHAWYALFLNYAHRFRQARGEADLAIHAGPRDGLAHAIYTRVLDWSAKSDADIKAAAKAGADAVLLGPHLVLTHTFYSEALADEGLTDKAKLEIGAAQGLLKSDPYEQAEVERELANLSHDTGDRAAELSHLEAAQGRQPEWAERTRELAEYYYATDKPDLAVNEFRHAISLAPDDPDLRLTLGDVALVRADIALADEAFRGAAQVKPHDAIIESSLAVTTYDLNRDTAATESLLRAAHDDAPSNLDVAELLQGFLHYIKRDTGAAAQINVGTDRDMPSRRSANPPSLDRRRQQDQEVALEALNKARTAAHLTPARLDAQIVEGATSHAYWWIFNLALPQVKGLGIHHEVPATPGFTGVNMRDRASHFGFGRASMAEDITHRGDPSGAIADWVNSVFHRFPLMRADMDAIGFGTGAVGILPIEVMDISYRDVLGDPRQMVAYPAEGQKEVPVAFFGNEIPDPVPTGGAYPTGYPITLNFNPFVRASVSGWYISDPSGTHLDAYVNNPGADSENVLSLLPKKQLKSLTTYTVHVAGSIDGTAFNRDWSFTTAAPG
jgi:Flp pilus assembly protein TadD